MKRFVVLSVLVVMLVGLAASAHATTATGPTLVATAPAACSPTDPFPFGGNGSVTGFPPNETFGLAIHTSDDVSAATDFPTDGSGANAGIGGIGGAAPFSLSFVIFQDPNENFQPDPGEATILAGFVTFDQPCQDGVVTVMARAKADCKTGLWQSAVSADNTPFRNQGQCVTAVTRAS